MHAPSQRRQRAVELHRTGRIDEALKLYLELLEEQPRDLELLDLAAQASCQRGRHEEGIAMLRQALSIDPTRIGSLGNLGNALMAAGRLDEAIGHFDRAITIQPSYVEAHYNRALALQTQGRNEEALRGHTRAIELRPGFGPAYLQRARALLKLDRHDTALADCERAARNGVDPVRADALRAAILADADQLDEALELTDKVLSRAPRDAPTWNDRANILMMLGRHEAALADYERAIELAPDAIAFRNNHANLLKDLRRFDEAERAFDSALERAPEHADTRYCRAELLLLRGRDMDGWREAEWRWRSGFRTRFPSSKPQWLGEECVSGTRILVHAEVGFGDDLMFARFLPLLAARGADVILLVRPALASLFASLEPGIRLETEGPTLPEHDFHCPMMSLPLALGIDTPSLPAPPYLQADPKRVSAWRKRLDTTDRPRIGVVWGGNTNRNIDRNPLRRRALALAQFRPLFDSPAEFHTLQKEISGAEREWIEESGKLHTHCTQLTDFAETAALIECMDLVISIDTAVAHLAGALKAPLWVLLPLGADYRWMAEGPTTPWYPDAELIRQTAPGNWTTVIEETRAHLETWIARRPPSGEHAR